MTTTLARTRRSLFAAAVAAAMGFGAVQALAQPAPSAPRDVCSEQVCKRLCAALGYPGTCGPEGNCLCYI